MGNNVKAIFFVLCGAFLAVAVAFSIISNDRNAIVPFGIFLGVTGFGAGILFGGKAMPWLIVLFGFSDLVKRFLALNQNFEQMDVAVILAAPPLVVLGMLLKEFQLSYRKKTLFNKENIFLLGFPVVIFFLTISQFGIQKTAIQDIANLGAYPFLVFILVNSIKTKQSLIKLITWAMVVFLAVALYGIKQSHFGFTAFEEAYLKSGLTIQSKQLLDLEIRPFSTVPTPGAYGYVCGVFSVLAFSAALALPNRRFRTLDNLSLPIWRWLLVAFALILGAAVLYSRTRACWAAYILTLLGAVLFQYRATTLLAYAGAIVAYIVLVLSAEFILEKDLLKHWTIQLRDWLIDTFGVDQSGVFIQSSRLQTFTVRLGSFSRVLSNPEYWSPFGLSEEKYKEVAWVHDSVTLLLIKIGYIPLFLLLGGIGFIFFQLHKLLLSLPRQGGLRSLSAALLSAAAGAILLSVGSGFYLHIFPVGGVFYFCLGLLVVIWKFHQQSENLKRQQLKQQYLAEAAA